MAIRRPSTRTSAKRARSRSRVNLWPRRIITGTILLGLIALLIWGVVTIVSLVTGSAPEPTAVQSAAQSGDATAPQSAPPVAGLKAGEKATVDGILDDGEKTVRIPECAVKDLDYAATAMNTSVGAGETITVTITNRSGVACTTAKGAITMRIVTGEETVYDSASCDGRDDADTPLLLAPDAPWSGGLSWDGTVYAAGCTVPEGGREAAAVGTYRAMLFVAGTPVTGELIFTIN